MYYLDVHQLYTRPTKAERVSIRRGLQRDKMMEQKLKNQHNKCFYCADPIDMGGHLDHVVPVRYGGTNRSSNLVASCKDCNMTKMVDQIEITNPYTINDYLRKQIHYRKWIDRINKCRYEPIKYRYLINNPPKRVVMAIVFRCDLFKEI